MELNTKQQDIVTGIVTMAMKSAELDIGLSRVSAIRAVVDIAENILDQYIVETSIFKIPEQREEFRNALAELQAEGEPGHGETLIEWAQMIVRGLTDLEALKTFHEQGCPLKETIESLIGTPTIFDYSETDALMIETYGELDDSANDDDDEEEDDDDEV